MSCDRQGICLKMIKVSNIYIYISAVNITSAIIYILTWNGLIGVGKHGVTSVTEEYQKFKFPDDKEFEMLYFGPTGSGDGTNPIGCKGFFSRHDINQREIEVIKSQLSCFQEYIFSKKSNQRSETRNTLADRLFSVVTTLCNAFQLSE
jgi:hypothetical protein